MHLDFFWTPTTRNKITRNQSLILHFLSDSPNLIKIIICQFAWFPKRWSSEYQQLEVFVQKRKSYGNKPEIIETSWLLALDLNSDDKNVINANFENYVSGIAKYPPDEFLCFGQDASFQTSLPKMAVCGTIFFHVPVSVYLKIYLYPKRETIYFD